jgi:hypothetical protein
MNKQAKIMRLALCFTLGLVVWRLIDTYMFLSEGSRFTNLTSEIVHIVLDLLLICGGLFIVIWKTSNAAERYLWVSYTLVFVASFVMSIAKHIPFPISFLFGVEAIMVASLWMAFVLWRNSHKQKNAPKDPA